MLDTRRRAGYLLLVVVLCQVALISAQVSTASGRSGLGVATFGAFAEIQRATASTPIIRYGNTSSVNTAEDIMPPITVRASG